MGIDFIKGINFGSKRKPLLPYWFKVEPKVLVEIIRRKKEGDDDIDWELKELEDRWKSIG